MQIEYQRHKLRHNIAMTLWLKMVNDFNKGIPAKKIAQRYTNPITKKPYTREHVYWVLKKFNTPKKG